jgi:hypothetical protein
MSHIITAAAIAGHVVIVERGGQVLLAEKRDVLHVRMVAQLEQCVAYAALPEGLDTEAARTRVQAKDQASTRFMLTQYRCQHKNARLYDLVINTTVFGLDSASWRYGLTLGSVKGSFRTKLWILRFVREVSCHGGRNAYEYSGDVHGGKSDRLCTAPRSWTE